MERRQGWKRMCFVMFGVAGWATVVQAQVPPPMLVLGNTDGDLKAALRLIPYVEGTDFEVVSSVNAENLVEQLKTDPSLM